MVWHHSLPLMNSFNKTEAAVFSCRLCFLRAFPFISLMIINNSRLQLWKRTILLNACVMVYFIVYGQYWHGVLRNGTVSLVCNIFSLNFFFQIILPVDPVYRVLCLSLFLCISTFQLLFCRLNCRQTCIVYVSINILTAIFFI